MTGSTIQQTILMQSLHLDLLERCLLVTCLCESGDNGFLVVDRLFCHVFFFILIPPACWVSQVCVLLIDIE